MTRTIGHRSKLHLRVRRLGGQELRLLTLRPDTDLQLANNHHHETWHLVTDNSGSRQLAHLLWAMSFQQKPNTVLLLDAPFVVPTPLDADRSRPVLVVPSELGGLTQKALEALQAARHGLGPPDTSVRIDTHGLTTEAPDLPRHLWREAHETVRVRTGFLEYRADRASLRMTARSAHRLRACQDWPTDIDLGDFSGHAPEGELQLYQDFRAGVRIATRLRSERGLQPGFATPAQQESLWWATDAARWKQRKAAERRARRP